MRVCLPDKSRITHVGQLAEVGKKPARGLDDGNGKLLTAPVLISSNFNRLLVANFPQSMVTPYTP